MQNKIKTSFSILMILCFLVWTPSQLQASNYAYHLIPVKTDSLIFPENNAINPIYEIIGGDLFVDGITTGIILTADNGSCWELSIETDGSITTDSIPCPAGIIPVDGDGNVYSKVVIGNQTWMGESLRTTSFNDGTSISKMNNSAEIQDKTIDNPIPGYVNFLFDDSKAPDHGSLYNHIVTNSALNGGHEVCPTGYKIPSISDYQELTEFLEPGASNNSSNTIGSTLKSIGNISTNPPGLWLNSNLDATNSSNFSATPGSYFPPFGFSWPNASFWLSDVDNSTTIPSINAFSMVNNNTWCQYGAFPNNFLYLSKIRCIQE